MFPITPHFYAISFALGFTLEIVTSIDPKEEITTYIFWECPKLD